MLPWFFTDSARVARERAAVEQLQQSAGWLMGTEWLLCGGLCVDAVIRAHGHDYEVRMEYPSLFPKVPPTVRPRNDGEHWSGHQYGNGGPLCLEWGPDNWHPDVTGAQVLESAYRLLDIENPLGEGKEEVPAPAPSRHALTAGQELRGRYGRFYVGERTIEYLTRLPDNTFGQFKFSTHVRAESWLAVVHEILPGGDASSWVDPTIPKFLRGRKDAGLDDGVFFKTQLEPSLLTTAKGIANLAEILGLAGHRADVLTDSDGWNAAGLVARPSGALVLDRNDTPHLFILLSDGDTRSLAAVRPDPGASQRTPDGLQGLRDKSVGVVGLGSAGGKVAISLARMGVRRFYFVDHDIFLPENVERHALDWGGIGDHKVDATCEALLRLGVDFEVEVSRTHLTGQESTAVVSGVLDKLSGYDLLVDATADAGVFNLMSAVATAYEKPLVWLQVYGGGFGGMIARSRPGRDPDPQTMRAAYLAYCHDRPAPEQQAASAYAAENDMGEVLAASDADVAIIAHHLARIAADTVLMRDPSEYPHSMYLIGLSKWWVFEAPFDTIPIATDHLIEQVAEGAGQPDSVKGDHEDNVKFIISLLEKLREASPST